MGARIRVDGRIVCAAMHVEEPGDVELDDKELYDLALDGALVGSETHLHLVGCPGEFECRGDHLNPGGFRLCGDGLWFWADPPRPPAYADGPSSTYPQTIVKVREILSQRGGTR